MAGALSPEKLTELKQIIHNQLNQMDVQTRIRDILSESLQDDGEGTGFGETELLDAVRQRGLVEEIMASLEIGGEGRSSIGAKVVGQPSRGQVKKPATHFLDKEGPLTSVPLKKANIDPTRRQLYLQIHGGKAFLEHLQEPEALPGQTTSNFSIHIHFRGQRFKSRPVPCACEPDFQEGFVLEVHRWSGGDAARMADAGTLLSLAEPIHMVLVKTDPSGETSLLSSHFLEWRTVLSTPTGSQNIPVELLGVGSESKVPVGILEVKLELLPKMDQLLTDEVVATQISLERNRIAERERLFLVYAKQWWREFLQIRPTHQNRLVKIFAQDENGVNRPVCAFVKPMRGGRLLDSARHAARFVSIIGYERVSAVGGGQSREMWSSVHAFLSKNKGDCEDHAVLLCNFLLGFGLNAFVCVGTKGKGQAHSWVMTLGSDGLVTFWESLTCQRYIHQRVNPNDPPSVEQPRPQYPYRTVGCIFNHKNFFANCQPSDNVDLCCFDLQDSSLWKAMSADALASVCGSSSNTYWPNSPPLVPSHLDSSLVSNELELQLRALTMDHRKDLGLTSVWDEELSYLLNPALASYETERMTGLSTGNEEFQQAIRLAVPDGHTFKGFPIQFVHRNARRVFSLCLRSPVCEEIICCRGDHVRLAVRVRTFTYPESACAVWVMFACKYKSVL
ncbi:centrosomal protein of 76 kDa-like [Lytechinus variegatus]|uniref:centrosomal protein of 76 kDa-like n=1 Tax=Lytechinus variegatus TaxID=7654 RepID=UPI001BB268C6|nr:centrosomal protein of 76 kDa-like [Lytechinus variegatus]